MSTLIAVLNTPANPMSHVLFLGYNREQTKLIDALIDSNCAVHHTSEKITGGKYDLVVSFGYRHILKKETLDRLSCPVINLHIAYLPYNRGAHPNFWSFYDDTPAGVTIHLVDDGIDTGPILYQKRIHFDREEHTFVDTYTSLIDAIEQLFISNISDIISHNWEAKPQVGAGTFHYVRDLPDDFAGWESNIYDEVRRLKAE